MRRWTEPVDLPLPLSQTKYNWSLAPAQSHVDDDRYVTAAQFVAGGKPWLDLIRTHTRFGCCCYMRRWTEPVDLLLLISQTKHNWSLVPAHSYVDDDRYVMEAQFGAGGKPTLDLIQTHTRFGCCCYMRRWTEPVDFPFLLYQSKHNWSLAPAQSHLDSDRHVMVAQCGAGGMPKLDLIRTHTRLPRCTNARSRLEPVDSPLQLQTNNNVPPSPSDSDLLHYNQFWIGTSFNPFSFFGFLEVLDRFLLFRFILL